MKVSSSRLRKCPRLMEKANPSKNPAAVTVVIMKKEIMVREKRETVHTTEIENLEKHDTIDPLV